MKKMALGIMIGMGMMVMVSMVFAQTNLTVVRHSDNTIWAMTCTGTSNCSAWTPITGGFSTQPTLTWDPALQKYLCTGIGNNGSTVWRTTFNADGTWNNDWVPIGSGATGSPSPVASSGGRLKGYFPNTAIVAPAGGDYTDPVAAMAHLSAWCPAPSFSSPCLLKLMPGLYNIGSNNLAMQPYVDLEGSGENVTTITGNNSTTNGVVRGASSAEIRFLTVINTGGTLGSYSIAIANISNSPKITHVTARAFLGDKTWGIYNYSASPTMTDVTVSADSGGTDSTGVFNGYWSVPIMSYMSISAIGGLGNYAVNNTENSQAFVGDTVATAFGGQVAIGFWATPGCQLNRSSFSASGASDINEAISFPYFDDATSLKVSLSKIQGDVQSSGGTVSCAFCFNQDYAPLDSSCQ